MNPNSVAGTPNVQAQPVQLEPNPMAMGPTKPGKGGAIAAVLFAILAVAGIGFGVWAMLDSKAQKDALNEQITTLKEQNNELRDKIAELEESCESRGTKCGNGNMVDYIYLDELGIKIKKPSSLPDMVATVINEDEFSVKESADATADDLPPSEVVFNKVSTCNDDELTLGYGAKIEIDGTCYIMGEILPYGSDPEYPLTTFLEHVIDPENYSAI